MNYYRLRAMYLDETGVGFETCISSITTQSFVTVNKRYEGMAQVFSMKKISELEFLAENECRISRKNLKESLLEMLEFSGVSEGQISITFDAIRKTLKGTWIIDENTTVIRTVPLTESECMVLHCKA